MTLTLLNSEVNDGVWRVIPPPFEAGRRPAIALISPPVHRDSGLFDRVKIRFRVVHNRPIEGKLILTWVNETNQNKPLRYMSVEDHYFRLDLPQTYTTDWQEIVVDDLRTGPVEGTSFSPILWEGDLVETRITLVLSDANLGGSPSGPDDIPEAVEIDWIQLTGLEEQLQGELPPPEIDYPAPFGSLLGPAVFHPLGRKGIWSFRTWRNVSAGLGDLDGDTDLDLIAVHDTFEATGWLCAFNDGSGNLTFPHYISTPLPYVQGGDIDMDGRMDVLVGTAKDTYSLLHNEGNGNWGTVQEFRDSHPLGMTDADGDADADLWMGEYPAEGNAILWLWYNDGNGSFSRKRIIAPELSDRGYIPAVLVRHVRGTASGVLWARCGQSGYKVTYLEANDEVIQKHLAADIPASSMRYVGDFDQDGDVDFIATDEEVIHNFVRSKQYVKLVLMMNQGDGTFESVDWYQGIHFPNANVEFFDLNGDGLLAPVVVDGNERNPAVLIGLGVKEGIPVPEGRYPLTGQGGAVVGGDLDNDGDVDLVVLERNVQGQGGVHVLLNQLNDQSTAVLEEQARQPVGFRLGANYPNPFNPQTWIPFNLPADSNPVQLRVYNLLGQPIRTLLAGPLSCGSHVVPWDGRDQAGQVVSSGLYLYCLQARTWTATGKMVKSE